VNSINQSRTTRWSSGERRQFFQKVFWQVQVEMAAKNHRTLTWVVVLLYGYGVSVSYNNNH